MLTDAPQAFLNAFASSAVYTAGGATTPLVAMVEDSDTWIGMCSTLRTSHDHGQVRLGRGWILPEALAAAPAFGDAIEQYGRTWTVMDSWPEDDMLVLGLAQGVFVVAVTVQRIDAVSDGGLGTVPQAVDLWTGMAAVHALDGAERLTAAREVGLGQRHGWMPACPDLAAGCRLVTPTETLHVTDAYTDQERGWTTFTAECRQEEQA